MERMIHVLFIVIELQVLLLSNVMILKKQKYHSSYSTATQRGIVDIERPQTSIIYGIRKTFIPSAECNYDG